MPELKKYKVLVEVVLEGEKKEVGAEVEMEVSLATPLVEEGKLEEVAPELPAGGVTPKNPESPVPPAPTPNSDSVQTPNKEEKKSWVGGHNVGGNENAPLRKTVSSAK